MLKLKALLYHHQSQRFKNIFSLILEQLAIIGIYLLFRTL
jgi:hypothetical protein